MQVKRHGGNPCRRSPRIAGFTLVELLVVIGIIALLISILLPALSKAREQGRQTVCLAGLRSFGQVLHLYSNSHKGRVPLGYAGNKHAGYMIHQDGEYKVLGNLYESGLLSSGTNAFYCPSKMDVRWQFSTPENPWPPPVPAGRLVRLGMTVRPQVQFKGMIPQSSTQDHVNFRGKFPQLSNLKDRAIAAEMFGEPVNNVVAVDPTILPHNKYINVYYADNSAGAINATGIGTDNKSILTILQELKAMAAVPSGASELAIYLNENVTPNTGIWAKFDQNK